jgi:hypothetical protein
MSGSKWLLIKSALVGNFVYILKNARWKPYKANNHKFWILDEGGKALGLYGTFINIAVWRRPSEGVCEEPEFPRWWYRIVPKHVGFIGELRVQAMKVHLHVLVCCFAVHITWLYILEDNNMNDSRLVQVLF